VRRGWEDSRLVAYITNELIRVLRMFFDAKKKEPDEKHIYPFSLMPLEVSASSS
jgi:hypothetical protein